MSYYIFDRKTKTVVRERQFTFPFYSVPTLAKLSIINMAVERKKLVIHTEIIGCLVCYNYYSGTSNYGHSN
jgi:hypothetical protein